MKKRSLLVVLCLAYIVSNAQKLERCSQCASTKYKDIDIKENLLFELQLLRNEIFARHHFSFSNERLEAYFSNYAWYQPNHNAPIKTVNLNAIELSNIKLFKAKEDLIKANRSLLISTLKRLKLAFQQNDTLVINSLFSKLLKRPEKSIYNTLRDGVGTVLNAVDFNAINWHKGKAQYTIVVDNGFSVSSKKLYITGNTITITVSDPMKHSKLMTHDDAFEYPSGYFSESEFTSGVELEFKEGELILVRTIFAG
jgi:hypothetical protein